MSKKKGRTTSLDIGNRSSDQELPFSFPQPVTAQLIASELRDAIHELFYQGAHSDEDDAYKRFSPTLPLFKEFSRQPGTILKLIRSARDLNAKVLADKLQVSPASISRIEKGKSEFLTSKQCDILVDWLRLDPYETVMLRSARSTCAGEFLLEGSQSSPIGAALAQMLCEVYFYLPEEDQFKIVHKALGCFLNSQKRRPKDTDGCHEPSNKRDARAQVLKIAEDFCNEVE